MNSNSLLVQCEHIFGDPERPQARVSSDATISPGPITGEIIIKASSGHRMLLRFSAKAKRALVQMLSRRTGEHITDIEYEEL